MAITYGGAPINTQTQNVRNTPYNPYNPYSPYNPYNQRLPRLTLNNSVNLESVTNISYYISIDIELKKGTTLSLSDKVNLKCNRQFNKIRKNLADLTGMTYSTLPIYDNLPSTKEKSNKSSDEKSQQSQSITRKKGSYISNKNITRKKM